MADHFYNVIMHEVILIVAYFILRVVLELMVLKERKEKWGRKSLVKWDLQ